MKLSPETYERRSGGGLGFVGALTIVFIVLKLTGVIDWSWWWVLSPIWISAIIAISLLAIFLIVLAIIGRHNDKNMRKR